MPFRKIRQSLNRLRENGFLYFLGPAFVASVAYMDPGNFATNLAAGSSFGYSLLWVLLWSNAMAIVIQYLSAKLGIVTGKTLPENCRTHFSRPVALGLWVAAEIAALATDLAEFLGAALGFYLLFHIPLPYAAIITAALVFLILYVEKLGFRKFEYVIMGFVGLIGLAYAVEIFLAKPDFGKIFFHSLVPAIDSQSIYVAVGMLGATVMPHVIYLHSALVRHRRKEHTQKHMRFERWDVLLAMNLALLVNAAMVIMSAAVFQANGVHVESIEQAHQTLLPLLGNAAAAAFALALLFSGLSSSTVGTLAGQVIMEGFLNIRVSIFLRRLITMLPALFVIVLGIDPLNILILSQVALSFALPFAVIPLVLLTQNRQVMGSYANSLATTLAAWAITVIVVSLNLLLVYQAFGGRF